MQIARLGPGHSCLDDFSRNEELRQEFLQSRPDRAGSKMLLTQQPGRHQDVRVNRPESYPQKLCGTDSPVLSFAQGIFIANHHGRPDLFAKLCQAVIRVRSQDKAHIALSESFFDVRYSGGKKAIVTQISVRIKRNRRKEDDHRLPKFIADLDSYI